MRDCMRRYRKGGGKVKRYTGKVLADGREVLVPAGEPTSHKVNTSPRHLGAYGEVLDGCACAECRAANMAPPVEPSAKLRRAAQAKLAKLKAKAMEAISDAKWAMSATILRKRDGSKSRIRRSHNEASLKLKAAAQRAVAAYKRAEAAA